MRIAPQIAAACLLAWGSPALPRAFCVDDLLSAEEFGQMGFTPDGAKLVFERQVPFEQSGPFEYDTYPPLRRSRIYVQDVGSAAPPRLLISAGAQEGHTAGPLSPDGRSMVVLRLKGRAWDLGVVDLGGGKVRWLAITPELAQLGRTIAWRSDHELVIAARADAPLRLRSGWQARETLIARWAASAAGQAAISVTGAAPFAGGPSPPPSGALLHIDLRSGKQQRLASGDFYDLEVSPNGRFVAAMANLEALPPSPEPRLVATPNRRRNLVIADLSTGALSTGALSTPCPDCDLAPHLIAWSPRSDEVLVQGRRKGTLGLFRLSAQGVTEVPLGGLELVIDRTSEGHAIPRAAWWRGAPIALMRPPGGRADWYRLGAGAPENLTAALPGAPPLKLISLDEESLLLASQRGAWRVHQDGSVRAQAGVVPMAPKGFSLSSRERHNPASSPGLSSRAAPARNPGAGAPSALAQLNPQGGLDLVLSDPTPRVVMSLNHQFAEIDFAAVHPISAQGPDGRSFEHYLLLPRSAGAKPPRLIVVPYPGLDAYPPPRPYGGGTGRFPANAELMAAAGYAVLIPALPRAPGGEPAEGLAAQILAAVDLAAETVGGFDAERPVLWGQSFGGYTALMAATQSERFAAVIASAAPSDLASVRGVFDPHGEVRPQDGLSAYTIGWSEAGQAGLRSSPWEQPDLYVRNSPVFQAGKIGAPVLLIHGDIDFVRLSQAQEMFTALARQGKDVTLITAYGEGHVVSSPGNARTVYQQAFEWLAERRTGAAEP